MVLLSFQSGRYTLDAAARSSQAPQNETVAKVYSLILEWAIRRRIIIALSGATH